MTDTIINASPLIPNLEFTYPATTARVEATAAALRDNGMSALVVPDGAAARELVLTLLPEGAEVFTATSRTLEDIGLAAEINQSGRYESVRARLMGMDRATQGREMRKLGIRPHPDIKQRYESQDNACWGSNSRGTATWPLGGV
jgi:hypothetical protein